MNNASEKEPIQKVTLQDLQDVFRTMLIHKRENGFMAFNLKGKLTFFDTEPHYGGVYITRDDVMRYIDEYEANTSKVD